MRLLKNKLVINLLVGGLILTSSLDAGSTPKTANGNSIPKNGVLQDKKAQQPQKWISYVSQESGFSVDLPQMPEHVHQKIDVPKTSLSIAYDTYVSEPSDSVVYVVSVWHYPSEIDMSKPEVNLQDGFGGMLSALPGSQVLNMNMTTVQGYKALEFKVKNEDIYFQGKLILVYNTLYQVFAVYKESESKSDNFSRFINSFKLLNPEQHKVPAKDANAAKKMNV